MKPALIFLLFQILILPLGNAQVALEFALESKNRQYLEELEARTLPKNFRVALESFIPLEIVLHDVTSRSQATVTVTERSLNGEELMDYISERIDLTLSPNTDQIIGEVLVENELRIYRQDRFQDFSEGKFEKIYNKALLMLETDDLSSKEALEFQRVFVVELENCGKRAAEFRRLYSSCAL